MKLHYYCDPSGNFGDDLNPWLWPRLFPKPLEDCFDDQTLFIGVGTLLNHGIPATPPRKIVFGSGVGYGDLPMIGPDWRIDCVRGPLSAQALGLPADRAITDSGLLVLRCIAPNSRSPLGPALMPHHKTARTVDWRPLCNALEIRYIDPADPIETVLEAIRNSSVLITEAMHGAIVADALRVPWIPIRTHPLILDFKWQDWTASMGLEHSFEAMPLPSTPANGRSLIKQVRAGVKSRVIRARLSWLLRFGSRRLSKDSTFENIYRRLLDAFEELAAVA
jgi:succinoglycan biosynthesis protein ExoV